MLRLFAAALVASAAFVHTAHAFAPCAALPSSQCQAADIASGQFNIQSLSASGERLETRASGNPPTWSISGGLLVSDGSRDDASPIDCVDQRGSVLLLDGPAFSSINETPNPREIRIRAKVSQGSAFGILMTGDNPNNYFRAIASTHAQCNRMSLFDRSRGTTPILTASTGQLFRTLSGSWFDARVRQLSTSSVQWFLTDEQGGARQTQATTDPLIEQNFGTNGGPFGVWCRGRCEFQEIVVYERDRFDQLVGPLDCSACTKKWVAGTSQWCRCCGEGGDGCAPYSRKSCTEQSDFCGDLCSHTKYCDAEYIAFNNAFDSDSPSNIEDGNTGGPFPPNSNEPRPCNCVGCQASTHPIGSQNWCSCCADAVQGCNCPDSVFSSQGCLQANFDGNCVFSNPLNPVNPIADPDLDAAEAPCRMTPWSRWSDCSKQCGGGTSTRSRSVEFVGNGNCGHLEERRACNETPCQQCNCVGCAWPGYGDFPGTDTWCRCCAAAINNCNCDNAFEASGCRAENFNGLCPLESVAPQQPQRTGGNSSPSTGGGSFQSDDQANSYANVVTFQEDQVWIVTVGVTVLFAIVTAFAVIFIVYAGFVLASTMSHPAPTANM